jgi:hypothetical protein
MFTEQAYLFCLFTVSHVDPKPEEAVDIGLFTE